MVFFKTDTHPSDSQLIRHSRQKEESAGVKSRVLIRRALLSTRRSQVNTYERQSRLYNRPPEARGR